MHHTAFLQKSLFGTQKFFCISMTEIALSSMAKLNFLTKRKPNQLF